MRRRILITLVAVFTMSFIFISYQNCAPMKARMVASQLDREALSLSLYRFWGGYAATLTDSQGPNSKPVSNPRCTNNIVQVDGVVVEINCQDYTDLLSMIGHRYSVTSQFFQNPETVVIDGNRRLVQLSLSGVVLGDEMRGRLPSYLRRLSLAGAQIRRFALTWNQTLEELDLSGNLLSDEEVLRIKGLLPRSLRYLNLGSNLLMGSSLPQQLALSYMDVRDNPLCGEGGADSPHITCQASTRFFMTTSSQNPGLPCDGFEFKKFTHRDYWPMPDGQIVHKVYMTLSQNATCIARMTTRDGTETDYCIHGHSLGGSGRPVFHGDIVSVNMIPATFNSENRTCLLPQTQNTSTAQLISAGTLLAPRFSRTDFRLDPNYGRFTGRVNRIENEQNPLPSLFTLRGCSLDLESAGSRKQVSHLDQAEDHALGVTSVDFRNYVAPVKSNIMCFYETSFGNLLYVHSESQINNVEVLAANEIGRILWADNSTDDAQGGRTYRLTAEYTVPQGRRVRLELNSSGSSIAVGANPSSMIAYDGGCLPATGPQRVHARVTTSTYLVMLAVSEDNCSGPIASNANLLTRSHLYVPPPQRMADGYFDGALACQPDPIDPQFCSSNLYWRITQIQPGKSALLVGLQHNSSGALEIAPGEARLGCVSAPTALQSESTPVRFSGNRTFAIFAVDDCNVPPTSLSIWSSNPAAVSSTAVGWSGCGAAANVQLSWRQGSSGGFLQPVDGAGTCQIPTGQTTCSPSPELQLTVSGLDRPEFKAVVRMNSSTENFMGPYSNSMNQRQMPSIGTSATNFKTFIECGNGSRRELATANSRLAMSGQEGAPLPVTAVLRATHPSTGATLAQQQCEVATGATSCQYKLGWEFANLAGGRVNILGPDGNAIPGGTCVNANGSQGENLELITLGGSKAYKARHFPSATTASGCTGAGNDVLNSQITVTTRCASGNFQGGQCVASSPAAPTATLAFGPNLTAGATQIRVTASAPDDKMVYVYGKYADGRIANAGSPIYCGRTSGAISGTWTEMPNATVVAFGGPNQNCSSLVWSGSPAQPPANLSTTIASAFTTLAPSGTVGGVASASMTFTDPVPVPGNPLVGQTTVSITPTSQPIGWGNKQLFVYPEYLGATSASPMYCGRAPADIPINWLQGIVTFRAYEATANSCTGIGGVGSLVDKREIEWSNNVITYTQPTGGFEGVSITFSPVTPTGGTSPHGSTRVTIDPTPKPPEQGGDGGKQVYVYVEHNGVINQSPFYCGQGRLELPATWIDGAMTFIAYEALEMSCSTANFDSLYDPVEKGRGTVTYPAN